MHEAKELHELATGLVVICGPPGSGKTHRLETIVADTSRPRPGFAVLRLDHMYTHTQLEPLHVLSNFVACRNRLVHSGSARKVIVLDDYDGLAAGDRGLASALQKALAHPAVTVLLTVRNTALLKGLPAPSSFTELSPRNADADGDEDLVQVPDDQSADAFLHLYENCALTLAARKGIVDACGMEAVAVHHMDWTLHKIAHTLKYGFINQCRIKGAGRNEPKPRRLAMGGGKTHPSVAARTLLGIHPEDAVAWQTAADCGLLGVRRAP